MVTASVRLCFGSVGLELGVRTVVRALGRSAAHLRRRTPHCSSATGARQGNVIRCRSCPVQQRVQVVPVEAAQLARRGQERPSRRVVPARDAGPTGGKGRGCCAQDIPAGVFGKPLRAIFRFRRQDIQTPPSPLVGKGGRGDEGQKRTGMQKITHLSQGIYP